MEEPIKKPEENIKINHQSNEIPSLALNISVSEAGFVTKNTQLISSGYTIDEAVAGMEYLLKKYKDINK